MPKENKEELLMKAKTKIQRLLGIMLALSMVVGMLPTVALAEESATKTETADFSADPTTALVAEGTPDCYIERADGSYDGYNWMGADPAVGDKDVYVHIVGTVPDGWTMVGGKWTGADYIDTTANPLLSKADCENLFTKSLTQTGKVSVGKDVCKKDVTIYRLTVDNNGTLEAGEYRIFFESTDRYYVPSIYNLSIPDPASSEKYYNSIGDMELPLDISTGTTSVSFSCTVNLYGENPDDATFELRQGSVNGTPVGSVSGSALQKSQHTGGICEFRGTMPITEKLTGGTELYLCFSHDRFNEAEWYWGPTAYVVPEGGAGQFILYGALKDTAGDEEEFERRHSTYEKAVPGATYCLTEGGDTTHTFVISGSSLSDVSKLSVTGGSLVDDSLSVSMKNGVYTVTGGVTVNASASVLSFSYDGNELHSINFDRTKLAGVTAPYVTNVELGQVYENGDFTVKLSGFNLGSDAEGYSGVNYSEQEYTCESLTECNGIYTLRFTPDSNFSSDGVELLYGGKNLETPGIVYDPETGYAPGMEPVSVWVDYPNLTEEDISLPGIADNYETYVGEVRGSQILTIHGKGFDSSKSYTACFVPHTSERFDEVKTATCTYVSDKKLTVNAVSVGTGWYTVYIAAGNEIIPRFHDIALYEDVSAPQLPVIIVNGGKGVTTSRTIPLSINGGDYTEVRVAESTAELASATWQPVDSLTSYTLSEGYGKKTLYFEFRTAENETYSETARVTYSGTALSGAEYGISGAGADNKVYLGSKYTLFIKYTGTGYVKGQAEIVGENGTVRETVELRRVSTVGTTSTYTGKTDFALTDKQIVFSLIDESGNAVSADPMAVTVAEELVITAANAPRLPKGSNYMNSNKISYSGNYTLEFNGTPGKTATAVFAFDAGEPVTVDFTETESKPGHYLFDGSVSFPAEATKLQSITYHLTGDSGDKPAMRVFEADEYEQPYSNYVLAPSLTITNIPQVYRSGNTYLDITPKAPESGYVDSQDITGGSVTFHYLNNDTTYVCILMMDGIVMRSWEVEVNGNTTFDYAAGEPVGTVEITMDITRPEGANWYVDCVYTVADDAEYQFSLPCNGTKVLPKQGTLTYEVKMSSEEKLAYKPMTGTVELSGGDQTITATPVLRSFRTMTGTVTSKFDLDDTTETAIPLNGAAVLVTQILTDDPSACIVNQTTTGADGRYSVSVCADFPVTITFSRYDHEAFQDTVSEETDTYDLTMQYDKRNLIIPKLIVKPIVDPEFAEEEALPPTEVTTDQLSVINAEAADPEAFYYWNTVIERDGMFKSVVRLSPPRGSEKESAYPNEKLKLQFVLEDERFVLDNGGIVTVNTDERSTAVAELTAAYKGYLRINEPTESNTIYMLVFDKAKYDVNSDHACVGMVYDNGLVTTEELHLDPGTYKVFVFKGSSLSTSVSTLRDVNLLKQFLKDGILHDENCTQLDAVVETGRITPLKNALPPKALTGDALCSIRFVTEQTESGDLRVKFYMDKLPAGKRVTSMIANPDVVPVNPAAPDTSLSGITYYTSFGIGYTALPSGEFYLGRGANNKAEGYLIVGYMDVNDLSIYHINIRISETLPTPHISLEMSPIFSTEEGKIDISGQTEPNQDVSLRIGGLDAGSVKSDARGHYAATLRVTGAENGSIYPITASVEVDGKTWSTQERITASTSRIEVLNIKTQHHNVSHKEETFIQIDNLYSYNQAQSQVLYYDPSSPTTVSFQLTGCKREAFDSVYLITYDQDGNEDKVLKARCTGSDGYTSDWEAEGNLGFYSNMGVRYFFNLEYIEDDLYELLTGQQLPDLSGLLNATDTATEKYTINLADAPNVIRKYSQKWMFSYGAVQSRSAAYTLAVDDEEEDDEAADTSFAYKQNLGGEGAAAGQLDANVSMAEPMTEAELEAAGYLKMDTQQGSVWIKQEVEGDEETGITYKRRMYFSPEIAEKAGMTTAATTFAARGVTDRALEGIDFIGNLQGGADFFHSMNKEMAEQFSKTALGSQGVGTAVTVLGAAGTVVKIVSGPSSQSPENLQQMIKLINDSDTRKRLYGDIQDYVKLSDDLYYTDCIGSSLLSGISFYNNATPLTKGATLFGGIAFGAINSWTADEIKSIYASIERSILAELQLQEYKLGRELLFPDFKILIDPSGYVFEAVEDNRVEGVTATVFEVDVSGNATAWTDNWTGQENPQTTGIDGRYGWDVPTGTWKVSFDNKGYQHAESKTMTVYPAHTEVNIGLLSTAVPEVTAAAIVDDKLEVQFSMYMQADTSSCAITVYDEDMQIVPGTVSFPKAVANTGYKKDDAYQRDVIAADQFTRWATFTPYEDYVGGFHDGETYTVKVSKNALSYAGVPMADDYTNTVRKLETVSTLSTPTASVDSGVFKTIQTVSLTAENGASIFYTTDGSEPNENSTLYTGPITLSSNTTLKFIAVKTGYNNSPVGEKTYVIELSGKASKPTANVTSGTYSDTLSVALSSTTTGSKIYYTLDGFEPTTSSAEYVTPISISATTTLKAIAVIGGLDNSDVSTFEYRISSGNSGGGSGGSSGGGRYTPPTYKVECEVSKDADGSVSFSQSNAKKGDAVTITVTPDRYYKVEGVIVKDKNGKEIAVTANKDGTFTFKMPDSKVTVEPVFSWNNPFVDVAEDTYYAPAVEWALKNDITNGTGDDTFSPNDGCTRGQIVTFLWKAAGCPEPKGATRFTDVSADAYYAKAVAWAVEQGITNGTDEGKFSPDAVCTRGQSMTFIYRCEKAQGGGMQGERMFPNPFADVNPEDYYGEAVMWAVANGVTSGTSDTTFSPNVTCTRGQIVTFLYRFFVK